MQDGHLHVSQRLLAGACAGMSATLVTHPLDVVRLRLSLPQAGYTGKPDDPSVSSAAVKLMKHCSAQKDRPLYVTYTCSQFTLPTQGYCLLI